MHEAHLASAASPSFQSPKVIRPTTIFPYNHKARRAKLQTCTQKKSKSRRPRKICRARKSLRLSYTGRHHKVELGGRLVAHIYINIATTPQRIYPRSPLHTPVSELRVCFLVSGCNDMCVSCSTEVIIRTTQVQTENMTQPSTPPSTDSNSASLPTTPP